MLNFNRTAAAVMLFAVTLLSAAPDVSADDNAALSKWGTSISVTCDHPRPLNDRWAKPKDMIREKGARGPIIHDMASAQITVSFPVELTITRVGIMQGNYKGTMAMPKEIEISAPGQATVKHTLDEDVNKLQWVEFKGKADQVTVKVTSAYAPPEGEASTKHGIIQTVQVEVAENLEEHFAAPGDYVKFPRLAMVTDNLNQDKPVEVIGKPRKVTEHPRTIWDKQDIAAIKAQINKHEAAKVAYQSIIAFCDKAVAEPIEVPTEPDDGVDRKLWAQHNAVATGIANLGIGYALSGNEAYAKEARRMLLRLAELYPGWPVHQHPRFTQDRKSTRLNSSHYS